MRAYICNTVACPNDRLPGARFCGECGGKFKLSAYAVRALVFLLPLPELRDRRKYYRYVTFEALCRKGLVTKSAGVWTLTDAGRAVAMKGTNG